MKKKVSLLLSVMMILTFTLSACGSSASTKDSGSSGPVKLVFSWWGNQVRNERTQQVLDMYSNDNSNVTFDGQFSEYSDYWNKMATLAAGKALPDIIQMDYSKIQEYVDNGLLMDLTSYVDKGIIDTSDCDQKVVASGKIGDGLYGICNGVTAPALLYNKTLLDKYGIKVKDNMTMNDFIALSKEVKGKTGYKTNISYGTDQFLEYYLRGDNVTLFGNNKLGGTEADYIKFFNLYDNGLKEGWHINSSVFAELTIGSVEQDPMVYGTNPDNMSWCAFLYSNMYTAYAKAAPQGTEIGISTLPADAPIKADYIKPSQFFAISSTCKNPEEAAKVINYLTNSVDCNKVLLGERGIPISKKVTEAIAPLLDAGNQKAITFINDVVIPNSSVINPPQPSTANQVYELVKRLKEQVCYGKLSGSDAGKQLFEEGNKIMASGN